MNATQKDRLHLLEKRAVRVITNSSVRDHTQPLFERLKFVGHETRHKVQLAKAVYKAVNSLLPKSLCDLFRLTADVSHKHTRARDSLSPVPGQKLLSTHSSTEEQSCGIHYQLRKEPFSHAIPSSRH